MATRTRLNVTLHEYYCLVFIHSRIKLRA